MNKHEIIKAKYGMAMNKMRAKLRFRMRDLGWLQTANSGTLTPAEWDKAERIANDWFVNNSHSPVRKCIADMTHKELQQAVTVMNRLLNNHYKQANA